MGWYEDLYEESWYKDGCFIIQQDPTADGPARFRVIFYGPKPAETYMQTAYVTKTDLIYMRRAIDKAIKADSTKEEWW